MKNETLWVNQRDSVKLLVITLLMIPVMLLALATSEGNAPFVLVLLAGIALCAAGGYWLGNRKWIVIPLLAMLVEITFAIPAVLRESNPEESPISIILEAPFWTGMPALIGAGVGYLIRRRSIAAKV